MSAATVPSPLSPDAAWRLLASGNERFVAGTPRYPHHSTWRRRDLAGGQHPFATVLTCSDSRVAPEIAFDRGMGDVFTIRNAGHVLDNATLGTIEYGVEHLHIPLIVVMGHEACGCVAATMGAVSTGQTPGGHIGSLVEAVTPSVRSAFDSGVTCAGEVTEEHVRLTMNGLLQKSPVAAAALAAGSLAIVGAMYRLEDGAVTMVDWIGDLGRRPQDLSPEMVHEAERAVVAQQSAADTVVSTVQEHLQTDDAQADIQSHADAPALTAPGSDTAH